VIETEYDCQSCGACCVSQYKTTNFYVKVSEAEWEKLPEHLKPKRRWESGFVATKTNAEGKKTCAALDGKVLLWPA